jgi:thiol-disulfide isomerase/thioredoxin
VRRWPPVVLGTVGAVFALVLAIGAGAVVKALESDPTQPKPEVSLTFDAKDDESGQDDLIGGDVSGKPAPDARFALLGGGDSMSLADLKGTPVVVNFFATWCVPCVKEMPGFEQVHQEIGDELAFVGIDLRDSESGARELVDKTGVTYTIGRDPSGSLFEAFDAVNMPSTFLIAADGTVVASHAGALTADELRDLIDKNLR